MGEQATRILVVDDESSVCEALALGLASQEVAVDGAGDGHSGVRLGYTVDYAVLIVDLCLPDMDGMEVARRIKGHQPDISIIVITAHSTREKFHEVAQLGVTAFLEKPFALSAVRKAVSEALAARTQAQK